MIIFIEAAAAPVIPTAAAPVVTAPVVVVVRDRGALVRLPAMSGSCTERRLRAPLDARRGGVVMCAVSRAAWRSNRSIRKLSSTSERAGATRARRGARGRKAQAPASRSRHAGRAMVRVYCNDLAS